MSKITKSQIIEKLERDVERLQKSIDKWADDFTKNPAYALEWSNSTFKAVAVMSVSQSVIEHLKESSFKEAVAYYKAEALRRSRYLAQSTSPTSNLSEDCLRVALSEMLDPMCGLLGIKPEDVDDA